MNIDFKMPLSGRAARKIAYASTIMKLDVDPKILEHVNDDLLTVEHVHSFVQNTDLTNPISTDDLRIIQHIADSNYRALLGTCYVVSNMTLLLLSALSSGKKVLIVDHYKTPDKSNWMNFLRQHNIPHVDGSKAKEDFDLTPHIIVTSRISDTPIFRKSARDRVLIMTQHIDESLFEMESLFSQPNVSHYAHYTISDLCLDFEFMILGFFTHDYKGKSKNEWHTSHGFINLASSLFNDNKLAKAMASEHSTTKNLNGSGVSLTSPYHIAKLLNVNVDDILKTEREAEWWFLGEVAANK